MHPEEAKASSSLEVELGSVEDGVSLDARVEFIDSHLGQSADQLSMLGAWMGENSEAELINDDFFNHAAFETNQDAQDEESASESTVKPSNNPCTTSR